MESVVWHLSLHERDGLRCLGVFATAQSAREELERQHPGRFTDWGGDRPGEWLGYAGDVAAGAWDDPYVVIEDLHTQPSACPAHALAARRVA